MDCFEKWVFGVLVLVVVRLVVIMGVIEVFFCMMCF